MKKKVDEILKLYEKINKFLSPEHFVLDLKSEKLIAEFFENHFITVFVRCVKIFLFTLPKKKNNFKFKDIVIMLETFTKILFENVYELQNSDSFKTFLKDSIQNNFQYALDNSNAIFELLKKNNLSILNKWDFLDKSKKIYAHTVKSICDQLEIKIKNCDKVYAFFNPEINKMDLECNIDIIEHKNEESTKKNRVKEPNLYGKYLFFQLKNSIYSALENLFFEINKDNYIKIHYNTFIQSDFDLLYNNFYRILFIEMYNKIEQQNYNYKYIIQKLSEKIPNEFILTQENFYSLIKIFFCETIVDCDNLKIKILNKFLKPKIINLKTYNLLEKLKKDLLKENEYRFEIYKLEILHNKCSPTNFFQKKNAEIIQDSLKIFNKYLQKKIKIMEDFIKHKLQMLPLEKLFHMLDMYNYTYLINKELYELKLYNVFKSYQLLEYIQTKLKNEKYALKECFCDFKNNFADNFENVFNQYYYNRGKLLYLEKEIDKNYDVKFFKKKLVKKRISKNFEILLFEFKKIFELCKMCELLEARLNLLINNVEKLFYLCLISHKNTIDFKNKIMIYSCKKNKN